MKNKISNIFWKGILTLLPLYLTVYFLFWLLSSIENTMKHLIMAVSGGWYYPGFGLLLAIGIVFSVGIFVQIYASKRVVELFGDIIKKIPLISELYTSISSFTKYLSSSNKVDGQEVVIVDCNGIELIGIVTRLDFSTAPKGVVKKGEIISVYIPMSYQLGGFTVYVPKEKTRKVEMDYKSALKWALMGGINVKE